LVILAGVCSGAPLPDRIRRGVAPGGGQGDLFGEAAPEAPCPDRGWEIAGELFELSVNGYTHFIHGWMSELPLEAELVRFAARIIAQGRRSGGAQTTAGRRAADRALVGWGEPGHETVLAASRKVAREIDRMRGLLRFAPNAQGVYTARCAPDYGILPGLAGHFTRRFGPDPWAVIDEKRSLCLSGFPGREPLLLSVSAEAVASPDPWEALWRIYHQSIAIESRANSRLQRQWMPARYWRYLSEMRAGGPEPLPTT
jgi:hypothetical protein